MTTFTADNGDKFLMVKVKQEWYDFKINALDEIRKQRRLAPASKILPNSIISQDGFQLELF